MRKKKEENGHFTKVFFKLDFLIRKFKFNIYTSIRFNELAKRKLKVDRSWRAGWRTLFDR